MEYIAYNLLNNYANSTEVKNIVDKYDFYIFPIVNPDGTFTLCDPPLSLLITSVPQGLPSHRPTPVSGGRTGLLLLPAAPATDVTSTGTILPSLPTQTLAHPRLNLATGTSPGRRPTVPPPALAPRPTKASHPSTLPKLKVFKPSSTPALLPLLAPRCTSTGTRMGSMLSMVSSPPFWGESGLMVVRCSLWIQLLKGCG